MLLRNSLRNKWNVYFYILFKIHYLEGIIFSISLLGLTASVLSILLGKFIIGFIFALLALSIDLLIHIHKLWHFTEINLH